MISRGHGLKVEVQRSRLDLRKIFFQPKGGEQLESASTAGGGCRHGQRPQERIGQLDHRK